MWSRRCCIGVEAGCIEMDNCWVGFRLVAKRLIAHLESSSWSRATIPTQAKVLF